MLLNYLYRQLEDRVLPACEVTTLGPITYENIITAFLIIPLGVFISLATLCFEHIARWISNQQKYQQNKRRPTKRLLDLKKSHLELNATYFRAPSS